MRYKKILEVREDHDRVYFSFFTNNVDAKIIGVPKDNCTNKSIYAGTSFHSLHLVEANRARLLLTELMKRTMMTHPAARLCDHEALKLIE